MEGPQLPAACPGNAFQFRGHTYVLITPEEDAVCTGSCRTREGV